MTGAHAAMRPHEAVLAVEGRIRAGNALRREAERLLDLADAQESEALDEVAAALGRQAAEMALAFVNMAGAPSDGGPADIQAIPGLVGRLLPAWLGPDAIHLAPREPSGRGLHRTEAGPPPALPRPPTASGTPPVTAPPEDSATGAGAAVAAPSGLSPAARPVPVAPPPVAAPCPEALAADGPAPASPVLEPASEPLPAYRADRPLTEDERQRILDSLTPDNFEYDRLAEHMRLLRPKGTVIKPWMALPPFPRGGKDKDVRYLDVKIKANLRGELPEVVYDALYVAHAGRPDLCVLYDKCMGYGVWRRKVFRAVIVHELGLELATPKSANARQRKALDADDTATADDAFDATVVGDADAEAQASALVDPPAPVGDGGPRPPPRHDPRVDPAVGGSGHGHAGHDGVAPQGHAAATHGVPPPAPGDGDGDGFTVDVAPTGAGAGGADHPRDPSWAAATVPAPSGLEHPDDYDPRDHLVAGDDDTDDVDDPDDGHADHPWPVSGDDTEGEADWPPHGDDGPVEVRVATPTATSTRSMRLGHWSYADPDVDLDRPPPRTLLDELPHDVARRLGVLPATMDAGSPPPVADDGTVGDAIDYAEIERPGGPVQLALNDIRLAAVPPSQRARLAAALASFVDDSPPTWTPTPPGVRGDGNLPPLDPATVGPNPYPRIEEPPFRYGHIYNTGVRAPAGYDQVFADARANKPVRPPPANAVGG